MERNVDRDDMVAEGGETVREGNLIIEEQMNRREGVVEYEGTVEDTGAATRDESLLDDAMQAGATVLAGTGSTALVDDAASMAGGTGTGGAGGASNSATPSDPLSMSTDNTPAGGPYSDTVEGGPISQVREGMRVVDAAGDEVGKVDYVKMGDPSAQTTMGEEPDDGGLLGDNRGGEPGVEEPFRSELIRVGFIKVDVSGWFTGHRYVRADQIASVSGDTVMLSVNKDTLPR